MENPTNPLTDSMAQPESEELKPTTTDRLPEAQSLEVADPTPLENESKSAEESKTSVNARLADMTELELLDSLAILLQGEELPRRQEAEAYKSAFYKKKQARTGESADSTTSSMAEPDLNEERLKDLLQRFRELNQTRIESMQKERESNLAQKEALLQRLRDLLGSNEEFGKISPVFHEIRKSWKETGPVPEANATDITKEYNSLVEQFYDLKQINDEFRAYDFKKNLEAKEELIHQAEVLTENADVIHSFRVLQELHHQWRELGPVARELREEVWARFKAASTAINKKYQEHFEKQKMREQENLAAKTLLCEEMEAIDTSGLNSLAKWDEQTKAVLEIQAKWKTIGYARRSDNEKIYERFRAACDNYFNKKTAFFKGKREELTDNYKKKLAMVEEAESLQESSDWKETSTRLAELQKKWKTIGAVPHRYSDEIWKRFTTACDAFFKRKKAEQGGMRSEERENLKSKKAIIAELETLDSEEASEGIIDRLNALAGRWNSIGFVPFREKNTINKAYRKLIDGLYDKLNIERSNRRLEGYNASLEQLEGGGKGQLYDERDRMTRILDRMRNELQTYTNNLGFLNISSKSGNSLMREMERKKEKLEEDIRLMIEKIKLIDKKVEELNSKE
ncbi:hypothetical protein CS546_10095 [Porphyromonas gingivalis]|uniref:DUF349 domain-containing protein n=1 Tax=Porphyromonas gingivalis TaxID=837 RepID=UPI000C19FB7C|nr:DUF349 domain-containing protein [Porphyromonas gingivalis]ATR95323.1 hypothetical protein CS546_10095 [Porphyromonas gingivalis]ATR96585.1 hypothetical protein CS548_05565 [Porphyromonas gingivalis]